MLHDDKDIELTSHDSGPERRVPRDSGHGPA
jgi:hypothetical protein